MPRKITPAGYKILHVMQPGVVATAQMLRRAAGLSENNKPFRALHRAGYIESCDPSNRRPRRYRITQAGLEVRKESDGHTHPNICLNGKPISRETRDRIRKVVGYVRTHGRDCAISRADTAVAIGLGKASHDAINAAEAHGFVRMYRSNGEVVLVIRDTPAERSLHSEGAQRVFQTARAYRLGVMPPDVERSTLCRQGYVKGDDGVLLPLLSSGEQPEPEQEQEQEQNSDQQHEFTLVSDPLPPVEDTVEEQPEPRPTVLPGQSEEVLRITVGRPPEVLVGCRTAIAAVHDTIAELAESFKRVEEYHENTLYYAFRDAMQRVHIILGNTIVRTEGERRLRHALLVQVSNNLEGLEDSSVESA